MNTTLCSPLDSTRQSPTHLTPHSPTNAAPRPPTDVATRSLTEATPRSPTRRDASPIDVHRPRLAHQRTQRLKLMDMTPDAPTDMTPAHRLTWHLARYLTDYSPTRGHSLRLVTNTTHRPPTYVTDAFHTGTQTIPPTPAWIFLHPSMNTQPRPSTDAPPHLLMDTPPIAGQDILPTDGHDASHAERTTTTTLTCTMIATQCQ
jgi:hypothetical protein